MAVKGLGIVLAALAAGGALLLADARARAVSALAALTLTPVLLVGELWDSPQIETLRSRPTLAAAVIVGALVVVAGLAVLLRRSPWLLAPLVVAALPLRVPLDSGGESANLLVPLYGVVAAGVVAYAWDRLVSTREVRNAAERNGAAEVGPWRDVPPGRLEVALVVLVVLYGLQSLYSSDFESALKNVAFFYVPFMLMLRLLTSVPWTRRALMWSFGVAVVLALLFVGVGFVEYATRQLFWNQEVIAANEFESYFRVNSVFFDPNIYGRFLAMVMIALATTLLWPRRGREVAAVTVFLVLLWGGMVLSFSQSSFAALLAGLAVLAALRWTWRPVAIAAGAVTALGIAVVLIAPALLKIDLDSSRSLDRATSGRLDLMSGGIAMFADRPLWGFGSGSFAQKFREREQASSQEAASASHTMPITFAAEQGLIGLAAYVVVLVLAFRLLLGGLSPPIGRAPPTRVLTRAYVAAAFTALVAHTLLYAAFLEDPITWTLLAAGIALARPAPGAASSASASSRPSARAPSESGT
jgi:O-antigen ligase